MAQVRLEIEVLRTRQASAPRCLWRGLWPRSSGAPSGWTGRAGFQHILSAQGLRKSVVALLVHHYCQFLWFCWKVIFLANTCVPRLGCGLCLWGKGETVHLVNDTAAVPAPSHC